MITSDAVKKIRKIQIITSRMAGDLFAGHYRSAFKGRGLEFGELREYEAGDDIRFMDWNVTARTGRPHVKKFIEERELTVLFLLDVSASSHFGTRNMLKSQLAAELCALLSFAALRNNDKIGLLLFTDRIEKYIAPKKGSRQALRIIRDALYFKPQGNGTDIVTALNFIGRVMKRRVIMFMMSDLQTSDFEKPLSAIGGRHDFIMLTLNDPAEIVLPDAGILRFRDAETGKDCLIDTSDVRLREAYRTQNMQRIENRRRLLLSRKIDSVDLYSDASYLRPLIQFFKMRERRLHSRL